MNVTDCSQLPPPQACARAEPQGHCPSPGLPGTSPQTPWRLVLLQLPGCCSTQPFTDTQGGFARDGCLQRLWLSTWFCPPVSVAQSRLLFAKLDSYPLFPDPLPSVPLVLTSQVIPVSTSHLNPTLTDPGPK